MHRRCIGGIPPLKLGDISLSISRTMKILLRDEVAGSFVGRETAWTKNVEAAAVFDTLEAAVQRTLEYVREDVVIVLRNEMPGCDLAEAA